MTLLEHRQPSEQEPAKQTTDVELLKETWEKSESGFLFQRRELHVDDISDLNLELKAQYDYEGNLGEALLRQHPEWKKTTIEKTNDSETSIVTIDPQNRAAQWLYFEDGQPTQMIDWAKDFPTAIALEPLQRLEKGGRMLPQGKLDGRTLELFTYMVDAIGIRTRAKIYSEDLVRLAEERGESLNIISVGSGAAVPNIDATLRIENELGKGANWKFFDTDPRALQFAHTLISEAKFQKSTVDFGSSDESSKYGFKGRSFSRAYKEPNESYDVVDALGLWEYLQDNTATNFAKKLYDKVAPGGMMIVSNMLKDRPQLEFNQRAVGWPSLVLRSEDDLLNVLHDADIDSRQVTMSHAEDGVYVVVEIRKP